ncbi:MAG: 50S ribosomal protein L23 [Deltaproteobacteria bacterium]|nr:MAG: 50S ribosomal protein L23 [Deltaproteobacteria bacterium]
MNTIYDIIRRPVITEKSSLLEGDNKFVFEVDLRANKHQIRTAVERIFGVDVLSVNTAVMQGKRKRFGRNFGKRSNWKKAVVTLAEGQTISFFEEGLEEEAPSTSDEA